jgi:CBS domain-containing protein
MTVKELMTSDIEEVAADMTLQKAADRMRMLNIGALPVCDEKQHLVGMITDRDIVLRAVAEGRDPKTTHVHDAMTPEVSWCHEDDDIIDAAQLMQARQIRRLVVCDHNDRPVGIVSLGDLATRTGNPEMCGETLEQICEAPATFA